MTGHDRAFYSAFLIDSFLRSFGPSCSPVCEVSIGSSYFIKQLDRAKNKGSGMRCLNFEIPNESPSYGYSRERDRERGGRERVE